MENKNPYNNNKVKPYLGITGITDIEDLRKIQRFIKQYRLDQIDSHIIMINLLISHRYFSDHLNYPHKEEFIKPEDILYLYSGLESESIQYAIHYNTHNKEFSKEIIDILSISDDNFKEKISDIITTIQLNIIDPDEREIKKIKEAFPHIKIILQVVKEWIIIAICRNDNLLFKRM